MRLHVPLSVLDFGESISRTIELAEFADRNGFGRFWLAEHFPQPSPIPLVAVLAGLTERIRVGTAGILLRYHHPHKAGLDFQLLERLYQHRIDAGFCAGLGSEPELTEPYLQGRPFEDVAQLYPETVARFVRAVRGEHPDRSRWPEVPSEPPQVWCVGAGMGSAAAAAQMGIGYGYSLFHSNSRDETAAIRRYREGFVASSFQPHPRVIVAVAGVCAASSSHAHRIAEEHGQGFVRPSIVGNPAECGEMLAEIVSRYEADELVFLDVCQDSADRIRCYELLAGMIS